MDTPIHKFAFSVIPEVEVTNCLKSLDTAKASSPGGPEANFLKLAADIIFPSLTKILNASLHQGHFQKLGKKL